MVKLRLARPTGRQIITFLVLWLLVGFASGTAVLLGPVRWLTGATRESGWSSGAESALVGAVIVLYVMLSFGLTLLATRRMYALRRRLARAAIPAIALAAAVAALALWMSPRMVNQMVAAEVSSVARFTFGPYPDEARFAQLRAEGYTAVVSLLHPAVVPFEPVLLARERELAARSGMQLIHAPMLPWISGNEGSLEMIRQLAESGTGRYYVHCYLGRDRTGVVQNLVRRLTRDGLPQVAEAIAWLEGSRAFQRGAFERGPIHVLDEGVYLTPYPTDEEMMNYFLRGGHVAHVVSLLDPANPDDVPWMERERAQLEEHRVPYSSLPLPGSPFDPGAVAEAVRRVRGLPRPVVVHGFLTDRGIAIAFRQAFESGLPPLDRAALARPLERGPVHVPAPNVAVGPRPQGPEFGTRLRAAGVRNVLRLGPAGDREAVEDRTVVTSETDLAWVDGSPGAGVLLERLAHGGPWYVYGPGAERIVPILAARAAGEATRVALGQGNGG